MPKQLLTQSYLDASMPRVISILSGKGGVGKSVIAFNLAVALAAQHARVLLVDADLACGDLHLLANVAVEFGLTDYASQSLNLQEASLALAPNLDLLAATGQSLSADYCEPRALAALITRLRAEASGYDFVLLDHASGKNTLATMLAHASDLSLLVAVPELTSLADIFGLYKQLLSQDNSIECGLLVNRTSSDEETQFISDKFAALSGRFLGRPISLIAGIPEDETLRQSVAAQRSIFAINEKAYVCQSVSRLAIDLSTGLSFALHSLNSIKKDSATADTRG